MDEELFVTTTQICDQIKNSDAYKERSKAYAIRYINEHHSNDTSQDLLCSMSEMPKVVQESQYFLAKLNHLSKKDKSERLAMKELRKTMEALKLSDSVESREQQKILAASVTNLEFGVPDLGLNLYTEKKLLK